MRFLNVRAGRPKSIFQKSVDKPFALRLASGPMSHRNSANATTAKSQLALVSALVSARQLAPIQIAMIVLVLVLLITNGGAG